MLTSYQVGNGISNGQGNKQNKTKQKIRIKMLIHKDTQSMKYSKDKSRVYQLMWGTIKP